MALTNLGIAITVLIAATITALFGELIYLVCRHQRLRQRVRSEPVEAAPFPGPSELEQRAMKRECMDRAPTMLLFTIKEEEREGLESDNSSFAESSVVMKEINRRLSVMVEELNEATTFSTTREVDRVIRDPVDGNGCHA